MGSQKKGGLETDFFTEYGEGSRYQIHEIIGKGSYGVVASAIDNHTGEKVAIKKINDVFEHVSDATRILREIKLLRLLRHPDIVEIKHCMLPPSRREFRDIYVVFELMESDLHQVIKANDDLTPEHHQFFSYQLLRSLKYIHSANVFHRDLKPKNILANADCKLKICDFGLARVSFNDAPSVIFWTVCCSFIKSLWVAWINSYVIRASNLWQLAGNVNYSWNLNRILKLRTEVTTTILNGPLSIKDIWQEIRVKEEKVPWHSLIWFPHPSGVDRFKRQFAHLEEHYGKGERSTPLLRHYASLPRSRVPASKDEDDQVDGENNAASMSQDGSENSSARSLLKSASISASRCVVVKEKNDAAGH
ncbi:mitogen-activated protein kinase 9-like [Hibiscus syriacus]|uniref:mitogen-activated protein kinase 9-like n=1 Tax=Hibiscus syriacus TaxID=106335 RepID=UPI001922DBE9|nr:mitogen-activated protein kinase 9-like [Hibiscus syriacus]